MKAVLIEWVDSCSTYGWHSKGTVFGISHCISVGVVISENKTEISLAPNISESSNGDIISIPKCSIKRIRRLKVETRVKREGVKALEDTGEKTERQG